MEEFRRHYVVEQVKGMKRESIELIPEEAFREALANALVHRVWYANARIIVSFYRDRIEIVSPGSLPADIDEPTYLAGGVSVPRNATLAYVFLRLNIIERLGTGVRRIQQAYGCSRVKPVFAISAAAIRVSLPLAQTGESFTPEEEELLALFLPGLELSAAELERATGFSRSTVTRMALALRERGALVRVGKGRATRYRLP